LAVELSLRTGAQLRRIALQLLVAEFGETLKARCRADTPGTLQMQASPSHSGGGAAGQVQPTSQLPGEQLALTTLPVDFFTMVFSCLPPDRDQEVMELRLSSQRVAKFIVYEFQEVMWGWLVATQELAGQWDVPSLRLPRR
jgi:hypothetical protein